MDKEDDDQESPMQRFEDLAKRLFQMAKEDVEKVGEEAKEAARDIVKPTEQEADE